MNMLAVRTPIAGIFIAVLVLLAQVVAMKAYVAAHQPPGARLIHVATGKPAVPPPTFGRHRGCADRLRISGPDDTVQPTR